MGIVSQPMRHGVSILSNITKPALQSTTCGKIPVYLHY